MMPFTGKNMILLYETHLILLTLQGLEGGGGVFFTTLEVFGNNFWLAKLHTSDFVTVPKI